MVGSKGKYRKVNPQLRQLVSSTKLLVEGLNKAPDFWWREGEEKGDSDDENDDDMMGTDETSNDMRKKPGQLKDEMMYLVQEE